MTTEKKFAHRTCRQQIYEICSGAVLEHFLANIKSPVHASIHFYILVETSTGCIADNKQNLKKKSSAFSHFAKRWQTTIYKPLQLLPRRLGVQDTPARKTILCARPSLQLQKILLLAPPRKERTFERRCMRSTRSFFHGRFIWTS